jgi:transglutaminase-like putative cysteine protease
LPYGKKEFKSYLQSTPLIQSEDERIIKLSANITEGIQDAEKAARMLLSWVYNNLEKKPVISIPSALEVLNLKAGDCNEHTTLYTALARSLGIPTRICVGIVYMQNSFYYHSWPEIFLGQWVAVDPTLNQFPADATHIRFVVGDLSDQIKILKIVNQLKVEILGYS